MTEATALPSPAPTRAGYVLGLLTAMYFFYLLDRTAVLVTQEMFKKEFGLTDTQVGLTTGLLYGGAYALVGLPLGRAIDGWNRTKLLAGLVAIWSGTTVLCGLATQFWHMAVARILVGGSESGGSPAALSILSDIFPPERRATVSSIFFAGAGIGSIVSYLLGGYIVAAFGWRAVFFAYGLPGLVLAGLILLTVREPGRTVPVDLARRPGLFATSKALLSDPSLLAIYVGSTLWTMSLSGVGNWMMPYWLRVHAMSPGTAGLTIALAFGVLSTVGALAFGTMADIAERKCKGGMILLLLLFAILNGLFGIALAMMTTQGSAIGVYTMWGVTALVYSGTANAAISRIAPSQSRGMAFALFAVLSNLIGAGLGPVLAGAISDHFQPSLGASSIRPAIACLAGLQVLTALAFCMAFYQFRKRE